MQHFEAIVLGTGGVGASALYHLARRGVSAVGIDRFEPGHSRGSSHGVTRIIRQAYFEHPDYVPLARRAFSAWERLQERVGRPLLVRTGLLQVGPPQGEVLSGLRRSAAEHALTIEELEGGEIERRWPGFRVPSDLAGIFEAEAGYLLVEECVQAQLRAAQQMGAQLRTGEAIEQWDPTGTTGTDGFMVRTDREVYLAQRLIICPGTWASSLLADLRLPLQVLRKPQYWYGADAPAYRREQGCPAFLWELPEGVFYGFPRIDDRGVKVARHTGGQVVDDPLTVDRNLDPVEQAEIERFLGERLPEVGRRLTHHAVCMYTMTPDQHFIVDRHPEFEGVAFAAGLSGHGFKFTPVLGEALADLCLTGQTRLPVEFLNCRRPALRPVSPEAP